jgi:hypothetical protein
MPAIAVTMCDNVLYLMHCAGIGARGVGEMAIPNDLHMQERKVEKDTATAEIAVVLNWLTEERRNPDHWERICLVRALSEVFSDCYSLAITDARIALTPRTSEARSQSCRLIRCSIDST